MASATSIKVQSGRVLGRGWRYHAIARPPVTPIREELVESLNRLGKLAQVPFAVRKAVCMKLRTGKRDYESE